MNFSEDQRKHFEMIQTVINRMAGNSFLIRGWTVTLVSALFALAAKDANRNFAMVSYFPCIMFWCIDAYYLWMERGFRALYNAAAASPGQSTVPLYSMNVSLVKGAQGSWGAAFFSVTMVVFHLSLVAVVSVVMWMLPGK